MKTDLWWLLQTLALDNNTLLGQQLQAANLGTQSTAVLKEVPCHQDEERERQIQIHKYKVKYQDMS